MSRSLAALAILLILVGGGARADDDEERPVLEKHAQALEAVLGTSVLPGR